MTRRELLSLACTGVAAACQGTRRMEDALAPRGRQEGTIRREAEEARLDIAREALDRFTA